MNRQVPYLLKELDMKATLRSKFMLSVAAVFVAGCGNLDNLDLDFRNLDTPVSVKPEVQPEAIQESGFLSAEGETIGQGSPSPEVEVVRLDSNVTEPFDTEDPSKPLAQNAFPGAVEVINHRVGLGETAFTIARQYNVPVRVITDWNKLGGDLELREGQFLTIPQTDVLAEDSTQTTAEDETPLADAANITPPPVRPENRLSAERNLNVNVNIEEPNLASGTTIAAAQAAASTTNAAVEAVTPSTNDAANAAPLIYPVQGEIIRSYNPGSNEGIDIKANAGQSVKAAADGSVVAITRNTQNVAVVVLRHTTDLITVYTNVDDLAVAQNDSVSQGQSIGVVADGAPSFVHFEVRGKGMRSSNPMDLLP